MAKKEDKYKKLLEEIGLKLDKVIAALAAQGKDTNKQIVILSKRGFKNKEIGEILGVAKGTIKIRKHRMKTKKKSIKRT